MNLNFIKKEDRQKYLIGVLILIAAVTFYIFKKDSFQSPIPEVLVPQFQPRKIEINFELLQSPIFKELRTFTEIQPFEGEVGQENPFVAK